MSPKLPIITPAELIRALERSGYVKHRSKGSHIMYRHPNSPDRLVCIPFHRKDLSPNTLSRILQQAGINADMLMEMLKK